MSIERRIGRVVRLAALGLSCEEIYYNAGCSCLFIVVALRMAAEGAVAAYEQVVGETWKPFDRPVENPGASLDRKAAEAQMAAFG